MLIRIEQLSKSFDGPGGNLPVLAAVTFDVAAGTIAAILGPSGCGKTTLLRLITGLDKPDSGKILLQNPDGGALVIEMVFQQPALLPWRTTLENVLLPLELTANSAIAQNNFKNAGMDLLRRMGLSPFLNYYPHQLSGGMKSRVALARALVTRPEVLLLDEAFSALDEITRSSLQDLLIKVAHDLRLCVIFVTHSIEEAVILSDRILVLSNRPATVVANVPVDLPREPSQRRDSSVTMRLRSQLRKLLNQNAASMTTHHEASH